MPKLPRSTSSATSSMASETIPSRPAKPHPDRLKIMHLFPDRPLALQLQQPAFEVSLLCGGLMSAPPSRASNDEGWLNAPLRQSDRYAPDFLHRPGNRQAWR